MEFKVGDRVKCIDPIPGGLTLNKRYIVGVPKDRNKEPCLGPTWISILEDDGGISQAYYADRFELVDPLTESQDKVMNGLRYNTGKPQLSYALLGKEVVEGECKVWEMGAKKYTPGNWLKGQSLTKAIDSVIRHASAVLNGEDIDPESGYPHVDHLVCAAKIVSQSWHTRPDLDDRPENLKKKEE